MKIQNGNIEAVAGALADLGANRLPYSVSVRLHNVGKAVRKAISDREELRLDLVKPYLPEGKQQVETEDPGYMELLAKIGELWGTEIEIRTGEPIDLGKLNVSSDGISVKPGTLEVLDQYGLLAGLPELPADAGKPPLALVIDSPEPATEPAAAPAAATA